MHRCETAQGPCKKDEACSQAVLFFSNWRHCHEVEHYGSQLTTPTATPLIAWAPVILSLLLFLLFSEIRQNKEILITGAHSNKLIGMERKECKVRAILKTMTCKQLSGRFWVFVAITALQKADCPHISSLAL